MKIVCRLPRFGYALVLALVLLLPHLAAFAQTTGPLLLGVTASPDPVRPGETVNYTFTATNIGTTLLSGISTKFLIPDNVRSNTYPNSPGSTQTGSFGDIPPGQSRTTFASFVVNAGSASTGALPPADGMVIHLNVVGSTGTVSTTATNDVTVEASPGFSTQISAEEPGAFAPGAAVSYAVGFGNTGATVGAAVLRAPVPAGTTFVSASDGGGRRERAGGGSRGGGEGDDPAYR